VFWAHPFPLDAAGVPRRFFRLHRRDRRPGLVTRARTAQRSCGRDSRLPREGDIGQKEPPVRYVKTARARARLAP
jgi:hypothetical protein